MLSHENILRARILRFNSSYVAKESDYPFVDIFSPSGVIKSNFLTIVMVNYTIFIIMINKLYCVENLKKNNLPRYS